MRLVLSAVLVLLVSGCSYAVQGKPVGGDVLNVSPPFSEERPTPSPSDSNDPTSPIDGEAGRVCSVLQWKDLPYKNTNPTGPPTQINYDSTFDESCKWQTKEGSTEVGVSLRFREAKPITLEKTTGTYDVKGRKVTYYDRTDDPEVQPSCVLVVDYAGGGLGIIVIDGSNKFGSICEQGKHIAEIMMSKEPT
ncbi:hypothetical protein Lesp02_24220 [Lentzea sp. NBRC 105346]|uniref:DUF3558 family protein n=1 Tax=Lentzea sp. NBRC 105346 TaxID=3032205 RepID=UPI0024A209B8|nr:DUF3558 family protein [Lentzea sp. NBRC 105346]GLZ30232.1 hypothetical protein Lesp02_24220 [Lentzea sp. NBRC 105346]